MKLKFTSMPKNIKYFSFAFFFVALICGGIVLVVLAFQISNLYYIFGLFAWFVMYLYFGSVYLQSIEVWEISHSLKPIPIIVNYKKLAHGVLIISVVLLKLLLIVVLAQIFLQTLEDGLVVIYNSGIVNSPYFLSFVYYLAFLGVVAFFFSTRVKKFLNFNFLQYPKTTFTKLRKFGVEYRLSWKTLPLWGVSRLPFFITISVFDPFLLYFLIRFRCGPYLMGCMVGYTLVSGTLAYPIVRLWVDKTYGPRAIRLLGFTISFGRIINLPILFC